MSGASRLVRNITANWVGLFANLVVAFFLAPFVVNKLGSIYYGIWAITLQFTGYLHLMDFGVRESVIRYTAKYAAQQRPLQLNRVLTTAFAIYTPIFLIAVLITLIAAWGFPVWFDVSPEIATTSRVVVILVGLMISETFIFNVFRGVLQGLHRFDVGNLAGIILVFARAAMIVAALNHGYGLIAISLIQLGTATLSGIVTSITAIVLLRRAGLPFRFVRLSRRALFALGRRMFGYSFYVFINNMGQKVIVASSAMIVGIFMPMASVTYYAIAGTLIDHLRTILTVTAQVFSPLTSHYAALRQDDKVRQILLRGSKLTLFIGLPIILVYMFMGREFIGLWMGTEFMHDAGDVLVILAAAAIFSCPHHTMSSVLYGVSKHKFIAYLRFGEGIANLALSIFLVKRYGLIGVALGTAIPHFISVTLILPMLVCRVVALPLRTFYVKAYVGPLLAAIPFALGALYINAKYPASNLLVFFLQVGLLTVAYLAVGYWLALDREEREILHGYVRRAVTRLPGVAKNEKNSVR